MRYRLRTLMIVLALGPPALAYVPGYFWMGRAYPSYRTDPSSKTIYTGSKTAKAEGASIFRVVRRYPRDWQVTMFHPVGKLESWLRGIEVYIELTIEELDRRSEQA